jgi:2-(1,2-epoxy-1,2-dihydrophenyl)acetyl-CoA isomerase
MIESFVRYEKQDRIAILTMNRPDSRNAIGTHQDCRDFIAALDAAQTDAGVSCIILTGAGVTFSAGGNLKAIKERNGIGPLNEPPDATRANYRRGVQRVSESLWNCEIPMIAAINGHAIGLGLDLACLCDIRIAVESAKFASSFIKIGIVPGDGGAWILPRAVGLSNAAELIFTGDTIDTEAAMAMGLISRVVPAGQLMDQALALAQRIVVNPARVLRLSKRLLREGQQQRLADVLELSAAFQALAHETKDHKEALDAFFEKRPPRFTGG